MNVRTVAYFSLAIWNLLVFITYGRDKRKAKQGAWRISEKTLLLESLCLGGIGALLGGQLYHHKTKKYYFWLAWLAGVLIDMIVIYVFWENLV